MIHTHSKHCVMVTLLYPGKEFRITHQEMIKGMKKGTTGVNYRWASCLKHNLPGGGFSNDTLTVLANREFFPQTVIIIRYQFCTCLEFFYNCTVESTLLCIDLTKCHKRFLDIRPGSSSKLSRWFLPYRVLFSFWWKNGPLFLICCYGKKQIDVSFSWLSSYW